MSDTGYELDMPPFWKVEERLPDKDEIVFAYGRFGDEWDSSTSWFRATYCPHDGLWSTHPGSAYSWTVTHWTPMLPDPEEA